jgi:ribosomal protein L21E
MEEERKRVQQEIQQMIQEYRETERVILEQNAQLMAAIGAN